MSYWSADENLVKIDEEQISIPADQGLSHTVDANSKKVSFVVPKSTEFIDGKSCYLEFDAVIENPVVAAGGGVTRLQMDAAGCGMMVQNLRIYSLDDRTLLEEIQEYNQLVSLKSDYDTDESLKGHRAITQAAGCFNPQSSSSRGASKSEYANLRSNPWFKTPSEETKDVAYDHATNKNSVKACVPLDLSGIFSGSIFPNMMVGLYIEIDLTPAPRIIRQLDSVIADRRRTLNPVIGVVSTTAGANPAELVGTVAAGTNAVINHIYIPCDVNSQQFANMCPFVVGEVITFQSHTGAAAARCSFTNGQAGPAASFIISEIQEPTNVDWDPAAGGGVGNEKPYLRLTPTINTLHLAAGGGDLIGERLGAAGAPSLRPLANQSAVISVGYETAASLSLSYKIDNLNLVVAEVKLDPRYRQQMMAKAREGSSIEFDIYSATNYKNSILASEKQATFQIHSVNSRAKSAVIIPTDASIYTNMQLVSSTGTSNVTENVMDTRLNQVRSGIQGICDDLQSVQFQIDGKMVPSRPVDTKKVATKNSISAIHLFEIEKALDNAGIAPRSFQKFMENFVLGRGFGLNAGVEDLRNKDFIVNLDYGAAAAKNKLFSTFVFHIRRIGIKQGYVTVTM
tara:strand:- start:1404 stop:3278 length:1875 start_codon:yes stop_codon:yes gene_type:complete